MHRCFEANQVAIKVDLNPIKATTAILYLWRTIAYNNSDWADLYINLQKYHSRWGVVEKVLAKTGSPIKARTMMYKVVVHVVLLYPSEIWVVTDAIMTVLDGFCHRIARWFVGMTDRKGNGGE